MIQWTQQEDDICEGRFKSSFFRNDEYGDTFSVYAQSPHLTECAEKCVEAFNSLTELEINNICKGIIDYVKACGTDEEFQLPVLDHVRDVLKYCWFVALYVNMTDAEAETAYIVEGEGDWGEAFGFVVKNNKVIYVGTDYFEMADGE